MLKGEDSGIQVAQAHDEHEALFHNKKPSTNLFQTSGTLSRFQPE